MPAPKAIVFDLGQVLVELDLKPISTALKLVPTGSDNIAKLKSLESWKPFDDFERGLLDSETFYTESRNHFNLDLDERAFWTLWNTIIKAPLRESEAIVRTLFDRSIPLFILTNSNAVHFAFVQEMIPWLKRFDHLFSSHILGLRKPEIAIYQKVAESVGIPPSELLFIDDRKENIDGALESGWIAEWCPNAAKDLPRIMSQYRLS